MSNPYVSRALYGLAIIANYGLTAFAIQLGAGKVPIPDRWEWAVPILSAVVTATLILLPKGGHENLSADADALVGRVDERTGRVIRHRDLTVVTKEQAVDAIVRPEEMNAPDYEARPPRGGLP